MLTSLPAAVAYVAEAKPRPPAVVQSGTVFWLHELYESFPHNIGRAPVFVAEPWCQGLPMLPVLTCLSDTIAPGLGPKKITKWRMMQQDDNPHCRYCGRYLSKGCGTLDHVLPASRGGRNVPENLLFVCAACNQHKADMTLEEWATRLQNTLRSVDRMLNSARVEKLLLKAR